MDIILFVVVGGICFYQGYTAYTSEKQNHIFTKLNLPLKDVKEYNHFCGKLIYGFGIVAMITFAVIASTDGLISILCMLLLLLEAYVLLRIYSKNEIKFIKNN